MPQRPVLDTMFRQRAARFREMGVFDPFARPGDPRASTMQRVAPRLGRAGQAASCCKLDGEIVAMRYNIVHGDRLFCLISSMSDDPALRPGGSPGKQCLLRVMQTMFDEGFRVFDMGEGLTDEKRHWCNVQIPRAPATTCRSPAAAHLPPPLTPRAPVGHGRAIKIRPEAARRGQAGTRR